MSADLSKADALFKQLQQRDQQIKSQEEARLFALREKTARLRALRLARDAAQAARETA